MFHEFICYPQKFLPKKIENSQLQVELEPGNVCLSVCLFGVAYLVDLSYSNLDFCVFEIFEDFSGGYVFCLAQF